MNETKDVRVLALPKYVSKGERHDGETNDDVENVQIGDKCASDVV